MTAVAEPVVAIGTVVTDDGSGYPLVRTVGGWMRVGWERSKSWAQVLEWHQEAIDNPDDDTTEPFKPVIMMATTTFGGHPETANAERLAAIREKLEPHFADIAYLCTRSWEAWRYGTMTEDDFIAADQDDEFMLDLAETVAKLVTAERDAKKERADRAEVALRAIRANAVDLLDTDDDSYDGSMSAIWVLEIVDAALAGDQPEATPKWECNCDGGQYRPEQKHPFLVHPDCPRHSTPEPPHLDPYPIVGPGGETDRWQWTPNLRTFAPRSADENGKAYSQDRADYGVQW